MTIYPRNGNTIYHIIGTPYIILWSNVHSTSLGMMMGAFDMTNLENPGTIPTSPNGQKVLVFLQHLLQYFSQRLRPMLIQITTANSRQPNISTRKREMHQEEGEAEIVRGFMVHNTTQLSYGRISNHACSGYNTHRSPQVNEDGLRLINDSLASMEGRIGNAISPIDLLGENCQGKISEQKVIKGQVATIATRLVCPRRGATGMPSRPGM
jgi:hypothetical protein